MLSMPGIVPIGGTGVTGGIGITGVSGWQIIKELPICKLYTSTPGFSSNSFETVVS